MRMWGSPPMQPSNTQGFTLLEILMVLLIVGLAGTIVVPRVSVIYDNLVLRGARELLLREIRALPMLAKARGSSFASQPGRYGVPLGDVVTVPEGWSIEFSENLRYQANGFCLGGVVSLQHVSGTTWQYVLQPPFCLPEQVTDADEADS